MKDTTKNPKKMIKSRKNKKVIYKHSNKKKIGLFVDDLSVK
ncbi:MAG: hypothetical protein V5A64_02295 [Candidatus Thermoplasmatota archaeon]